MATSSECIVAAGSRNKDGYVRAPGRTYRFGKRVTFAHQVALIDYLGRPPRLGFQANHGCDNPECVSTEPGHIYEGTQRQNIADRHARGRDARHGYPGESNSGAKLTQAAVDSIRSRYAAGGVTQKQLACEYGVTPANISMIITRKTWV